MWGDPHYVTFDTFKHNFQGDCEYTIVRPCGTREDLDDFHIWGDNVKIRPSHAVSYLRKVVLEMNGTSYALMQNREVLVNDVKRTPPLNYPNGVTIRSDYSYAVSYNSIFFLIQWMVPGRHGNAFWKIFLKFQRLNKIWIHVQILCEKQIH